MREHCRYCKMLNEECDCERGMAHQDWLEKRAEHKKKELRQRRLDSLIEQIPKLIELFEAFFEVIKEKRNDN